MDVVERALSGDAEALREVVGDAALLSRAGARLGRLLALVEDESAPEEARDLADEAATLALQLRPSGSCAGLGATPLDDEEELEVWVEPRGRAKHCFRLRGPGRNRAIPLRVWDSSKVLSALLLEGADAAALVRGKRVLEVGAGFHGLGASSALEAGASSALATDHDPQALRWLRLNTRAGVARFDWAHGDVGAFEAVVGADVVHERGMAPLLLGALGRCVAVGGCAVLVLEAAEHRYGVAEFQQLLLDEGWAHTRTPAHAASDRSFELYVIRR